jgi:putative thioredoxin
MATSPYIVDADASNFARVVLESSHRVPVLVDFWAAWCAPCRTLMPILAKLVEEYKGRFLVAKVNTDEQRELAARFGIRSLPTVRLFRNGKAVDEFMGALPEGQIREFIERHVERESDRLRHEARQARERGDGEQAVALLRKALAADPENYRIHVDLAQVLIERREYTAAQDLIRSLPANRQVDPEFQVLASRLQFASAAEGAPDVATLQARIAADAGDCEARYQLAALQVLAGDLEAALEQLLEVMRRNRGFRDDAGRAGMVAIFDMLGGRGPLVTRYRGLMSSALY